MRYGAAREHPRLRGDNGVVGRPNFPALGTSPLTRGQPDNVARTKLAIRNIPAYAGTTQHDSQTPTQEPEHPRLRGDNPLLRVSHRQDPGTSPLTRGQRLPCTISFSPLWNIPAYAGTTQGRFRGVALGQEHPRLRGDNTSTNSM